MTLPLHAAGIGDERPVPLRRIRATTRRTPLDLAELWRYRDLCLTLALRDG
jgi:hypothetical protein